MYRSACLFRYIGKHGVTRRKFGTTVSRFLGQDCARSISFSRHFFRTPAALNRNSTLKLISRGPQRSCYSTGFPEHIAVPLPALSPTMEMGTIVRWTKEEGEELCEGDLLAEIETDKATMGFETPEEGYLAKIIIQGGSKDVPIGKVVCIIVANKEDVAAFKDYTPPADGAPVVPSSPSDTSQPISPPPADTPSVDYPEHTVLNLPSLSPTMTKGNLSSWMKEEGEAVAEGDVIAQIETDKATVDFDVSEEGFLAKILIPAGSKDIPLGQAVCIIVPNEEDIAKFKDYTSSAPVPAAQPAAPSPAPAAPQTPPAPASQPPPASASHTSDSPKISPGGRVFSTPLARTLARERNIDLTTVKGTGPDGQIRATDVENFVPSAAVAATSAVEAPPPPPPVPGAAYTDIPLTSMRQVIAKRLLQSKQTIPHYYLSVDITMDNILKLRKQLNTMLQADNIKLSVNDFIVKAVALACKKVPDANSSWQETFIRQHHTSDVCVAVATDAGLITPIVAQAEKKGLATIQQEVAVLAQKAKEGKLQPHEFQGGTFTISNLGMFGIKNFAAVINPPQACILAVGGAQETLIVDKDSNKGYRSATVMSVTLSCDHRVVDGAVGAQWLKEFRSFMERPETMLL